MNEMNEMNQKGSLMVPNHCQCCFTVLPPTKLLGLLWLCEDCYQVIDYTTCVSGTHDYRGVGAPHNVWCCMSCGTVLAHTDISAKPEASLDSSED